MSSHPKRYLVTAALPYANGPLHIGHLAGAYIPADIYVRYLRQQGEDVVFVCGSDEHGAAITMAAKKEGTTPQSIVDKYHEINKTGFKEFGISFDIYHRTSSELHKSTAADYFKTLYDKGVFEEKTTQQYYDTEFDQFLADRYITGTCPICTATNAYGDQCENCGSTLDPTELIEPTSTLSGNPPVLKETKHWFLPMQKYEDWLNDWIKSTTKGENWRKHVLGQVNSWLTQGLQARAMTRDLDWGVPVPVPNAEGKVLYVWLDAPIGYISATKALLPNSWEDYWKDEGTKLVHFIGKDNIVFHCIIFPILLKMHGGYILPSNVPANQFVNLEGSKMSTSRNYAVWLHEYLKDHADKQDVLRYVLTADMPENKDSVFTWKNYQDRNNNELVGVLGNFINRIVVLTHKYFNGVLPTTSQAEAANIAEPLGMLDSVLMETDQKLDAYIRNFEFKNALDTVMSLARAGNKFLTDTEPWKLIKTDVDTTALILQEGLKVVAALSYYLRPFLPLTTPKINSMLQLSEAEIANLKTQGFTLPEGHKLAKASLLFSKIDDAEIKPEVEKLAAIRAAQAEAQEATTISLPPLKDAITFDDFAKLDMRTGTIIEAKAHPNADKLLQLRVDIGLEQRTIVSGIAQHYSIDELVGKQVIVLANLQAKKLRGVESKGMILMATENNGKAERLHFLQAFPNNTDDKEDSAALNGLPVS